MKIQSHNLILFFFVLLVPCSGCKKQADETAPTKTSCLIATQTIKELISTQYYQQSKVEPETVVIEGKSFQVSTTRKSAYTYDIQNRIITEYNQYAGNELQYHKGTADSVYYQYIPGAVRERIIKFTDKGKQEENYVDSLNSQGYLKEQYGGQATYDKDGYLISRINDSWGSPEKIVNGNVIESGFCQEGPLTECYIYTSDYDLTKPGLSPVKTFYGNESRNLRIKYRVNTKPYLRATSGHLEYTATYSYLFDNKNRVKRQIFRGIDNGFIFGGSPVTTTDYTYVCP